MSTVLTAASAPTAADLLSAVRRLSTDLGYLKFSRALVQNDGPIAMPAKSLDALIESMATTLDVVEQITVRIVQIESDNRIAAELVVRLAKQQDEADAFTKAQRLAAEKSFVAQPQTTAGASP